MHSAVTLPVIAVTAFTSGILFAKLSFPTPVVAAQPQARFDDVVPLGMTLQVAVLLDKNTGDIWYYDLDKLTEVRYAATLQALGRPLTRTARIPIARAEPAKEEAYVAAMKSDLRDLVIAEEAFFADSVKYTTRIGPGGLQFAVTSGNSLPVIRLTPDGWTATIRNANKATICAIFVGSTPTPPATKEAEPKCQ
jgi:hypothetical protein